MSSETTMVAEQYRLQLIHLPVDAVRLPRRIWW